MLDPVTVTMLAFLLEFMNNSMGGGYGTVGGPVLLLFGYSPGTVVPAILFSEAVSEYLGGIFHIRFENVHLMTLYLTMAGSIVGTITAIYLMGSYLPAVTTKLYISVLAILMGGFVILKSFDWMGERSDTHDPSRWKTLLLGLVCGFNKSSTGGGYGPISTSGYMLLGLPPARAVGTTILAKATACVISIVLWAGLTGIDWSLTIPMSVGALIAAPVSSWLNNHFKLSLSQSSHGRLIGIVMTVVGVFSLLKQLSII